jgi:hypothetical protein
MLQGQSGLAFYSGEPNNANGLAHDFFWNGKVRDDAYHDKVRELAGIIARDLSERTGQAPPAAASPSPATPPAERTVYLARPARDMANAHARLVRELVGHDYTVIPDHDIPADEGASAIAFIDEALARASVSIHLLGFQSGYAPEGASPIAKLQLERAALRVGAGGAAPFRRIVWAPKVLEKDPPDPTPVAERDPLQALEGFAPRLDGDKVDGQILSKFVDFLFQNLSLSNSSAEPFSAPVDGTELPKVYLCHGAGDEDFAGRLADALSERQVEPLLRIFDGDPDDVEALHHRRLQECDAVAVCWAQSPQAKIAMQTNEWKDWRQLQRSRRFVYKALVKGPPLDARKARSRFLFPRDEIDLQIELDADLKTCSDRIAQLIPRAGGAST